jgi:hypothetical protein
MKKGKKALLYSNSNAERFSAVLASQTTGEE